MHVVLLELNVHERVCLLRLFFKIDFNLQNFIHKAKKNALTEVL